MIVHKYAKFKLQLGKTTIKHYFMCSQCSQENAIVYQCNLDVNQLKISCCYMVTHLFLCLSYLYDDLLRGCDEDVLASLYITDVTDIKDHLQDLRQTCKTTMETQSLVVLPQEDICYSRLNYLQMSFAHLEMQKDWGLSQPF